MRLSAMFGSSSATIGATAVGAIALVAGALGFTVFNAPDDVPEDQPVPAIAAEAPLPDAITVVAAPDSPEGAITLEPPRLDLVRVDAAGETVVAGQTSADLTVAILLDGAQVAVTQSDGAGDFVSLLTLPPSVSPRTLTVEAWPEDAPALAGLETVFIAPVAEVTPDPDPVLDPEPVTVAAVIDDAEGTEPADVAAVVVPETAPNAEDVAVAVPDLLPDTAPTDVPVEPVLAEPTEDVAPIEEAAPIEDVAVVPGDPQDPPLPEQEVAPVATPDPVEDEVVEVAAAEPASDAPTPRAPTIAPTTLTAPVLSAAPIAPAPLTGPAQPQPARAAAPAIVISGPEGLRVIQSPTPEPEVQTSVRLDAISYDAEGQVILAGRGPAAADIQVYLNNQPIQLGEIGPGGAWSLQLPDVDPGTYTLAVAELAEDGSTASRIETPFLREDPDRVAEAPVAQAAGIDVITVQPGFTLWGIARDTFGDGVLYVQIFEENQEQIDDPNWIFPGQIFRLPDVDQPNREN